MSKLAVIIFANMDENHTEVARVTNALQVAQEFSEAGDDVQIIFDGAGVATLAALLDEENQMHGAYQRVKQHVTGACRFCSRAFDVSDTLEAAGVTFLDDYKQHPSVRALVAGGYDVMTF